MPLTQLLVVAVLLTLLDGLAGAGYRKCPTECACSSDIKGRHQTVCTGGGMNEIPVTSIDKDTQVIVIRGPRNHISIGPIFNDFRYLEVLRVTDSLVPAIGQHTFWGVVNLKVLDLSRNNITSIREDNFRGQDNLLELDLSGNKIVRIPSASFRYLNELRTLNLAENFLEELVPRQFLNLASLKWLDLSENPLVDLKPEVFRDVQELKVFRCRRCQLKTVNPMLYSLLRHLTELDLGDNLFRFLDKEEFTYLKRLRTLKLDGNQLSVLVDYLFEGQRSLQHLDVSHNRIVKVSSKSFENLNNLTHLDLSYNKLMGLDMDTVTPLTSLKVLNISGHLQLDLVESKYAFQLLGSLTTLSVAEMGYLPATLLDSVPHLRDLNISGNHLNDASLQMLGRVSQLQRLDLSRNQIKGIDMRIVNLLVKMQDVDLAYNPITCDRCHMGALIDRAHTLKWSKLPSCFLPESHRGTQISDIDGAGLDFCISVDEEEDEDTNAASTSRNILSQGSLNILALIAGLVFIILAMFILSIVVCYSRHRARYYTHEDKRDLGATEKSIDPPATITSNEINFKFPIDDHVCITDELCLPPPPPPPSKQAPTLG
ncbi:insulin-like growth factor-binding protein complex acid labile subunit [Phlebotomus argentipes]|uniref:insulin-like growth factor-binding protein complex acid labile subunit n=1 Tax=Phlebotomus argentipes TaxID=94469 RepID=UPI0028936C30|nr:insulin-like growth factor-binding protein complex acid labile subunit [Phlebotomus argentipes]